MMLTNREIIELLRPMIICDLDGLITGLAKGADVNDAVAAAEQRIFHVLLMAFVMGQIAEQNRGDNDHR